MKVEMYYLKLKRPLYLEEAFVYTEIGMIKEALFAFDDTGEVQNQAFLKKSRDGKEGL
ncbi:hypothetical protein QJS10_CPA05g01594 [Acorus calamus]|uniref:Uncharacterized protein n=1 Tax=Acorus calamus TaxID=4465 RepID=A0AAV9EWG6_ACOCL|nr:hypothetical protein QJS10_CPA05g01594 [Acorus calamus]